MTSNLNANRLTCQESVELVTDYLEEALLPEMEARFNRHLDTYPCCTISELAKHQPGGQPHEVIE